MLWKIWNGKNICMYEHKKVEPHVVAEEVLDCVLEFNKGNPHLRVKKKSILSGNMEHISKGVFVV